MTDALIKNIESPNSRYLVFTSAGDNANLRHWQRGFRNFDLWISYYGDVEGRYSDQGEFYIARKGGKFPNLSYVHRRWKKIIDHYHAVFVMDDDIIIDGSSISRLFQIREEYDLWLLQPAFDPRGKISHAITQVKPFSFLRYANFVEVTCPLFRKDKLDEFMSVYDPTLVGWGVDWWYMDALNADGEGKVAIIDDVSCINPEDRDKGGQREIDRLQDTPTRIMNWERIRKERNIEVRKPVEFGAIGNHRDVSGVIKGITVWVIQVACTCAGSARNLARRFADRLSHYTP